MNSHISARASVLMALPEAGEALEVSELRLVIQEASGGVVFPLDRLETTLGRLVGERLVLKVGEDHRVSYRLSSGGMREAKKLASEEDANLGIQPFTTKGAVLIGLLRYGPVAACEARSPSEEELADSGTHIFRLKRQLQEDSGGVVRAERFSITQAISGRQGLEGMGLVGRLEEANGRRVFYYLTPAGRRTAVKMANGIAQLILGDTRLRDQIEDRDDEVPSAYQPFQRKGN